MLVECTVRPGGARLITIRLLASADQLFLLKAVEFSLCFCLLQFRFTELLNLSRVGFVRRGCAEGAVRHAWARSSMLSGHRRMPD